MKKILIPLFGCLFLCEHQSNSGNSEYLLCVAFANGIYYENIGKCKPLITYSNLLYLGCISQYKTQLKEDLKKCKKDNCPPPHE
jgi:hypothetical protein